MPMTQKSIKQAADRLALCETCKKRNAMFFYDGAYECPECHKFRIDRMPSKLYGTPDMSVLEEMNLPANKRQTLANKISMIDKCNLMQQALDQVKFRARGIPLLDDEQHAASVQVMTDMFLQAYDLLWKAAQYGIT